MSIFVCFTPFRTQESTYQMTRSTSNPRHQHTVTVTRGEEIAMQNNGKVFATSSVEEGHSHVNMEMGVNKVNGMYSVSLRSPACFKL